MSTTTLKSKKNPIRIALTDFKKILVVVMMMSLVLGWAHYFIYASTTRSLDEYLTFKKTFAVILILGVASIPLGFIISLTSLKKKLRALTWLGYLWMGIFHLLFFSSLFDLLVSTFIVHDYSWWSIALTIIVLPWALHKGLKKPTLITHEIQGPESVKGMTLVQISDLHVGLLHLNAKWLKSIVERINELEVDIVAITGDLVEGAFHEVSPQLQILASIKAKAEKFYITGNHEYIHGTSHSVGATSWETRLTELGFQTMHNENKILQINTAKILFAGVPDRMVKRFDSRLSSRPDLALQTSEKVDYKILLAHEPASVHDLNGETCDLILSGHTHGGQIFPFGLLVRMVQPVVKGFKKFGDTLVFAHQGTGLWGPPMRWFSRSEIVLIKWI